MSKVSPKLKRDIMALPEALALVRDIADEKYATEKERTKAIEIALDEVNRRLGGKHRRGVRLLW